MPKRVTNLGFVNMVVEDAELMNTANELAKRLATGADRGNWRNQKAFKPELA